MSSDIARSRRRRRAVLTCVDCRKRKQKCDRQLPCAQCIARGTANSCTYDKYKSQNTVAPGINSTPPFSQAGKADSDTSILLQHAHQYGYANADSLNSMGLLAQAITDVNTDNSTPRTVAASQIHSRLRSEYYGYVRRLPSVSHCEILVAHYFLRANAINSALDETIFREQLERWWALAYEILFKNGPQSLPEDVRCFPALLFQVLAISLQFLPPTYNVQLEQLKFGPYQTFDEVSVEYTDCGVAISNLVGKTPTLIRVQHSFLRDNWLMHRGELTQAWYHSGQTVKDAMAIKLHLEPEIPSSSQPETLLDALWMNELRKRTWLNLVVWDSSMALALGRPMFINQKDCTVTAPLDCDIPNDRLHRVPVPRSEHDKPTPMTERLLRYRVSAQHSKIRELESQGPIPRSPEKVQELHNFALEFQKTLPAFYQVSNPDTSWDAECPFLPTHRELLSYLINAFMMSLHRPYIFTRDKSQRQVYETSMDILESQSRLFESMRAAQTKFYIGSTFPTFDAAILLAVVLVSNPERYHKSFAKPYKSLKDALKRLQFIGNTLLLAKTGAEILQTTLERVVEAQKGAGLTLPTNLHLTHQESTPITQPDGHVASSNSAASASISPDSGPWQFETNPSAMDWVTEKPNFSEFDFSNLEVPMPLKELLLDEDLATLADSGNVFDPALWMPDLTSQHAQESFAHTSIVEQQPMENASENSLWNFLAGYSAIPEG